MLIPPAVTSLLRQNQEKLQSLGSVVATAESCTGGLLAYLFTELPGSSAIYLGGVSAYANGVKLALLGVDPGLLERHGAVSPEVARAMALGVQQRLGSQFALSLTGVAGPGGGSRLKPVGTVFCGLATPGGASVFALALRGSRSEIRWAAAEAALHHLATALEAGN